MKEHVDSLSFNRYAVGLAGGIMTVSMLLPLITEIRKRASFQKNLFPKMRRIMSARTTRIESQVGLKVGVLIGILKQFEPAVFEDQANAKELIQLLLQSNSSDPSPLFKLLIIYEPKTSNQEPNLIKELVVALPFLLDILALAMTIECDLSLLHRLVRVIEWGVTRLALVQLMYLVGGAVNCNDASLGGEQIIGLLKPFIKWAGEVHDQQSIDHILFRMCDSSLLHSLCREQIIHFSGDGSLVSFAAFSVLAEPLFVRLRGIFHFSPKCFNECTTVSALFHDSSLRTQVRNALLFDLSAAAVFKTFTIPSIDYLQQLHRRIAMRETGGRLWNRFMGYDYNSKEQLVRPKHRSRRVKLTAAAIITIVGVSGALSAVIAAEGVGAVMAFGGGWMFAERMVAPGTKIMKLNSNAFTWPSTKDKLLEIFKPILGTVLTLGFAKLALNFANGILWERLSSELAAEARYSTTLGMARLSTHFVTSAERPATSPWFNVDTEHPSNETELDEHENYGGHGTTPFGPPDDAQFADTPDSSKSNFAKFTLGGCHLSTALAISMRCGVNLGAELGLLNWVAFSNKANGRVTNHQFLASTSLSLGTCGMIDAGGAVTMQRQGGSNFYSDLMNTVAEDRFSPSGIKEIIGLYSKSLSLVFISCMALQRIMNHASKTTPSLGNKARYSALMAASVLTLASVRLLGIESIAVESLMRIRRKLNLAIAGSDAEGLMCYLFSTGHTLPSPSSHAPSIKTVLLDAMYKSDTSPLSAWANLTLGSLKYQSSDPYPSGVFELTSLRSEQPHANTDTSHLFDQPHATDTSGNYLLGSQQDTMEELPRHDKAQINERSTHIVPANFLKIESVIADASSSLIINSPTSPFRGLEILGRAIAEGVKTPAPIISLICAAHSSNISNLPWRVSMVKTFLSLDGAAEILLPPSSALFLFELVVKIIDSQNIDRNVSTKQQTGFSIKRFAKMFHHNWFSWEGDDKKESQGYLDKLLKAFLDQEEYALLASNGHKRKTMASLTLKKILKSLSIDPMSLLHSPSHFLTSRILGLEVFLVIKGLLGKQNQQDREARATRSNLFRKITRLIVTNAFLVKERREEAIKVAYYALATMFLLASSKQLSSTAGNPLIVKEIVTLVVFLTIPLRDLVFVPYTYCFLHRGVGNSLSTFSVSVASFNRVLQSQILLNGPADGEVPAWAHTSLSNSLSFDSDSEGKICGRFVLQRGITFEQVDFTYPGAHHPALCEVNVHFPANKMTGIIGPSGSGKSTIIGLLLRLHETVSSGSTNQGIFFDGIPITMFNINYLRSSMVVVTQSASLVHGATIAEQIGLLATIRNETYVTLRDVVIAAKVAQCHDFIIRKPNGYNHVPIPRDGGDCTLSSGEMQRLVLARALLYLYSLPRNSMRILILDEASDRLDALNEAIFTSVLSDIQSQNNCTIISISHRMSTLKTADKIIAIENGNSEEQVAGNELNLFGKYRHLQSLDEQEHQWDSEQQ